MISFFKENPALLLGFAALTGAVLALHPHWSFAIAGGLFLFLGGWRKAAVCLVCALAVFSYAKYHYFFPEIGEKPIEIQGKYCIHDLSMHTSPFQKSYVYQGVLKIESGNIPCRIYIPLKKERIKADRDFWIEGSLLQKGEKNYVLKNLKWKRLDRTFSSAEIRFKLKERLKNHLKEVMGEGRAASFLLSMLSGEIDEKLLSYQFSKLGLQHILGVSGFQFVLLAGFVGLILRLVFPYKVSVWILLLFLGAYFWVLKDSPPVFRAFVMIGAVLTGRLFNRRMPALNALGLSLLLQIGSDPLVIRHLGFQLSYLCTGAILLVYPWMRDGMGKVMPRRYLQKIREMSLWSQHGYIASSLIRETLALNFAVHLTTIPVLLFYFHKFSLTSLVYNLFFPFGAAVVFMFFLVALSTSLLFPPLGLILHWANGKLTSALLMVAAHPPASLDLPIRIKTIPLEWVVFWVAGLVLLSLRARYRSRGPFLYRLGVFHPHQ